MLTNLLIGVVLLAVAAYLHRRNVLARRAAEQHPLSKSELDFLARQHRRRLQANVMLGGVGIAIAASSWVHGALTLAVYWMVVMGVVIWITLLAIADLANTRAFYRIVQADQVAEHARLIKEMRALEDQIDQQERKQTE